MKPWSPFARDGKPPEPARTRGRRRQRPAALPSRDGADLLTDKDAAHAAEVMRTQRDRPGPPAWVRFASVPAVPVRREHDSDAVLSLDKARRDYAGAILAQDTASVMDRLRLGAGRDYGTGPSYDVATMGRHPS